MPTSTAEYIDDTVGHGTYTYQVAWVNAAGTQSQLSRPVTIVYQSESPPAAVTGLHAPSPTVQPPSLAWVPVAEADHYIVYRTGATPVSVTRPEYVDTRVGYGTYTYRVAWVNASGTQSRQSAPTTVIYQANAPPPPISGLSAKSPTTTAPVLTWNPTIGADHYIIYRDNTKIATPTAPPFTDQTVDYGTHTYKVGWKSGTGIAGQLSASVRVTYNIPAPAHLQATPTLTNAPATMTWDKIPRAAHYTVYRDGNPIGKPTTTRFTDSPTPPDAAYTYAVTATSGGYESEQSTAVTVTYDTTGPTDPTRLQRTNAVDTDPPAFSWLASTDLHEPIRYVIYRNNVDVGPALMPMFTDTNAPYGPNTYEVVAIDHVGNVSGRSHSVNIPYVISAPTGLMGPTPTASPPALSWNQVPGAASYTLYRNGSPVYSGTGASYTDANVKPHVYSYTVTATDANGNESTQSPAFRIIYT